MWPGRWCACAPRRWVVVRIDFEIRLAGELTPQVLADLRDAHLVRRGAETVLRGPVQDQAALIGIINWLQMLGVELREVRQIAAPSQHGEPGHERRSIPRTPAMFEVEIRVAGAMDPSWAPDGLPGFTTEPAPPTTTIRGVLGPDENPSPILQILGCHGLTAIDITVAGVTSRA